MNDVDLVNLCADIYGDTAKWDYLDAGQDDEVYFGLKKYSDVDVIVFRGSITALDWWLDLQTIPTKTRIGTVHHGFYEGMEKMWAEVQPMLTQPVMVTGHSLGAARADILTGLMVADNKLPIRRAVFGEPRPGLSDFAEFIKGVDAYPYRNGDAHGHDRVCDVPLKLLHPLDFSFVHPKPHIQVTAAPTGNIFQRDGLFSFHHIQLYQAALAAHFAKEDA